MDELIKEDRLWAGLCSKPGSPLVGHAMTMLCAEHRGARGCSAVRMQDVALPDEVQVGDWAGPFSRQAGSSLAGSRHKQEVWAETVSLTPPALLQGSPATMAAQ